VLESNNNFYADEGNLLKENLNSIRKIREAVLNASKEFGIVVSLQYSIVTKLFNKSGNRSNK
jgi:hypothetical protein